MPDTSAPAAVIRDDDPIVVPLEAIAYRIAQLTDRISNGDLSRHYPGADDPHYEMMTGMRAIDGLPLGALREILANSLLTADVLEKAVDMAIFRKWVRLAPLERQLTPGIARPWATTSTDDGSEDE